MAERRIEGNFNQGWGVASFITLLVVLAFVVAFTINRKTHRSPNDVLAPSATAPSGPSAPSKAH